jgi:hypothetical protein
MLAGQIWEVSRLASVKSLRRVIGDLYELSRFEDTVVMAQIDRVTTRILLSTECSRTSEGRNLRARGA